MVKLGRNIATNTAVFLTPEARRNGTYVIGTTGSGKTTLLKAIAIQDMEDPTKPGLCVLDPHGDLINDLLLVVPKERRKDVVIFAPGEEWQFENPMGLNLFECNLDDPRQVRRVSSTVIDTLKKLFEYSWGPRMEDLLRNSILTLLATPGTTLLDLLLLLASKEDKHRKAYTDKTLDPVLRHYWDVQFEGMTKDRRDLYEIVGSSLNKIGRFLTDPLIRNVVCQSESAFKMQEAMRDGKILLINLSKGNLGEDNSTLLGSVLVNLVLIAALQRQEIKRADRRPFNLIVDEYQNFATGSFPTLQSEARKYGINLVVAHQYRDQLDDLNKGSTLNVGNLIVLRVTGPDSMDMARQFDNTPPPAKIEMQPYYSEYTKLQAPTSVFIQHEAANSAGKLFYQAEGARRPFSDMQSERANDMATLPAYQAYCRVVRKDGKTLVEHLIEIEQQVRNEDQAGVDWMKSRALAMGTPRERVEALIKAKVGGIKHDIPSDFESVN